MRDKILVINCGSSSIKFSIIDPINGKVFLSGLIDHMDDALLTLKKSSQEETISLKTNNFSSTLKKALNIIKEDTLSTQLLAVGHRVVHGGEFFSQPTLVNPEVIDQIKQCSSLAPLHNPVNLLGIQILQEEFPELPQIASFDTAFHHTIPDTAFLYPVPRSWYHTYHVRKYGFHGMSHQYVSHQAIQRFNLGGNHGILSIHLGNGCSLCAIQNGCSVDTTMGMTPLDGLMMGTRSGSIDPGIFPYLLKASPLSFNEIMDALNKDSGLLGVSGISNDMRILHQAADSGHEAAQLALDMFARSVAKHAAAMITQLAQLNCIIFTGGIGENDSQSRQAIIQYLNIFGVQLDHKKNISPKTQSLGRINSDTPIVCVIATNEEFQIAQDTYDYIRKNNGK